MLRLRKARGLLREIIPLLPQKVVRDITIYGVPVCLVLPQKTRYILVPKKRLRRKGILRHQVANKMKKIKHISTAVILIVVGIALGVLPIVPGFLFAIIGYLILGIHFPILLKPLDVVVKKNKKMQELYEHAKVKVKYYL
jgi:hypothetical protein